MNNNTKLLINEDTINRIIRNVLKGFIRKTGLPDGVYELSSKDDFEQYKNDIWKILQRSYKPLGGFKSYSSPDDMVQRISLAILCVSNGRIVACAIYRDELGEQKLNGCGTLDGSDNSKQMLRNIIKDDIENLEKYHWVEVGPPLERWFKEEGGNPIPSKLAPSLLHKSKKKITETGDGVHYTREIGSDGGVVTKAIYGFNSISTYNKVMYRLEEYTGFENYDDFKTYINSLPEINEELDYLENHPNKSIAIAMEVVIQIDNLWEDGYREITPRMRKYLYQALQILQCCETKTGQINSLIKNGTYYYKNMDELKMHSLENEKYILFPLFNKKN